LYSGTRLKQVFSENSFHTGNKFSKLLSKSLGKERAKRSLSNKVSFGFSNITKLFISEGYLIPKPPEKNIPSTAEIFYGLIKSKLKSLHLDLKEEEL
jgi:hypothetical protein